MSSEGAEGVSASSGSPATDPRFPVEATRVSVRRAVAHTVDGVIFLAILVALTVLATLASDTVGAVVLLLGFTVGQVAYFVVGQRRHGRSPGKRLVRIRVVDAKGEPPTSGALIRRSIPLVFEYFWAIVIVAMFLSSYRQRLGNRWGGTYVIADAHAQGQA